MHETVIRTQGLSKSFGKVCAVADVDLEVRRGEVFGYLGPNGAGKTTTIRLLTDLIRPSRGRVEIFSAPLRRGDTARLRRIGFLPGEFSLYDSLTCRDYLDYCAALRGGVDEAFLSGLLERLQCEPRRRIGEMSLGNKRKVGLIQAFMHQPELLILDEPTSGLDPLMQQVFHQLIDEAGRNGQTVFLSSHNLPEVERICRRVAIIRAGRIVAVEEVQALARRRLRQVEIVFSTTVPAAEFGTLPGIAAVQWEGRRLRCRVSGDLNPLLRLAARFAVEDIISREPSLEEHFLAYYGDEHAS